MIIAEAKRTPITPKYDQIYIIVNAISFHEMGVVPLNSSLSSVQNSHVNTTCSSPSIQVVIRPSHRLNWLDVSVYLGTFVYFYG